MPLAIWILMVVLPIVAVGQVSEIAAKFKLPTSQLPTEEVWQKFLQENLHDNVIHFANRDSSKVYGVIVLRNNKIGRELVDDFYTAKGQHTLAQTVGPEDTVSFLSFPWYAMKHDGIYRRASPAFSTGIFKAPDSITAVKYFALHDLVTKNHFQQPDAIWTSTEFRDSKPSVSDDPELVGVPYVVNMGCMRLWYIRMHQADDIHAKVANGIKLIDPRYHQIEDEMNFEVVSNKDFTRTLIPFAFKDPQGARQLGYLYFKFSGNYGYTVYLWRNNKTPVNIPEKDRVRKHHVALIMSFPTSGWKPDNVSIRKYLFSNDFWEQEVETKDDKGKYKYLVKLGIGFDVRNALWH